jgi:hypothetical protein
MVPTVSQHRLAFGQQEPSKQPLREHTRSSATRGTSLSKKAASILNRLRSTTLKTALQSAIFKQRQPNRGANAPLLAFGRQVSMPSGSTHSSKQQELFESPLHRRTRFQATKKTSSSKKAAAASSSLKPTNSGSAPKLAITEPSGSRAVRQADPRVGCNLEENLCKARVHRAARQEYWDLCDEAIDSGDYKPHSTLPDWRRRALVSHVAVFNAVKNNDRPIRQAARLVRSIGPGKPSRNNNPAAVAAHLQPAISSGDLSEQTHSRNLPTEFFSLHISPHGVRLERRGLLYRVRTG